MDTFSPYLVWPLQNLTLCGIASMPSLELTLSCSSCLSRPIFCGQFPSGALLSLPLPLQPPFPWNSPKFLSQSSPHSTHTLPKGISFSSLLAFIQYANYSFTYSSLELHILYNQLKNYLLNISIQYLTETLTSTQSKLNSLFSPVPSPPPVHHK